MNGTVKIRGGIPLVGEVTPIPNKNAILAALPACILTDQEVVYHNVPDTSDVKKLLEILEKLGAFVSTDWKTSTVKVQCKNINTHKVDMELGRSVRASILFAGPLLARIGKAEIPLPGGCVLGKRSIAAHVDAFTKAGVQMEFFDDRVVFFRPKKSMPAAKIWLNEASVTGTENLLMYLAGIDCDVFIQSCACEPHVLQLTRMLMEMGAEITGEGSSRISLKGKNKLSGAIFTPLPDHIDIADLIVSAAVTKGRLKIIGANDFDISAGLVDWYEKFGVKIVAEGQDLIVSSEGNLEIDLINSGFPMAGDDLPKFVPRPWPGFPIDALPTVITLASKTKGKILIQNWIYENGLDFTRELNKMGADIFTCDPQRVIVSGPVVFKGGEIVSPNVIQACKALFLAALCDDVETTLHGVNCLSRRYPDIFNIYKSLGANIEVLDE